jgi:hypothetical protein
MTGIAEWLASIGLGEYAQRFAENAGKCDRSRNYKFFEISFDPVQQPTVMKPIRIVSRADRQRRYSTSATRQ